MYDYQRQKVGQLEKHFKKVSAVTRQYDTNKQHNLLTYDLSFNTIMTKYDPIGKIVKIQKWPERSE